MFDFLQTMIVISGLSTCGISEQAKLEAIAKQENPKPYTIIDGRRVKMVYCQINENQFAQKAAKRELARRAALRSKAWDYAEY